MDEKFFQKFDERFKKLVELVKKDPKLDSKAFEAFCAVRDYYAALLELSGKKDPETERYCINALTSEGRKLLKVRSDRALEYIAKIPEGEVAEVFSDMKPLLKQGQTELIDENKPWVVDPDAEEQLLGENQQARLDYVENLRNDKNLSPKLAKWHAEQAKNEVPELKAKLADWERKAEQFSRLVKQREMQVNAVKESKDGRESTLQDRENELNKARIKQFEALQNKQEIERQLAFYESLKNMPHQEKKASSDKKPAEALKNREHAERRPYPGMRLLWKPRYRIVVYRMTPHRARRADLRRVMAARIMKRFLAARMIMRFRRFARNVALIAGLGHGKGIPIEKQKNLAPVKTPIKPKGKDVGKQFEVAVRGNAEPPHLVKRYAPENEFMKKEYPTAKF